MNECAHVWRWLPQPVYTFHPLGSVERAENVECERCEARAWAHGRMPQDNRPPLTTTPTTDRS